MSQPKPVITEEPQPQPLPPPGFQPSLPGQYEQEHPTPGQPMMAPGQPMMAPGQPMMAPGQPMMAQGQPMMAPGQPMMAPGQPMMAPGQPMMAPGQPMMAQGQPMMAQGHPMMQPVQMQPQTTSTTTNVVMINQQPAGPPPQRDWSTGLCGCFEDCGSCFFALCCYTMLLADVSGRLGEGRCYGYCCPGALLGLRIKARTKYNIEGSLCKDTCATYLCNYLVLCQLAREMDYVQGTR